MKDRYDRAYDQGYEDGFRRSPPTPPTDDSEINYRDGYADGRFKRETDSNELHGDNVDLFFGPIKQRGAPPC